MNIICPKCSTIYTLDRRKLLPNGKSVKCIKCFNVWFEKYFANTKKEDIYRYPLPVIIKKTSKKLSIPIKLITIALTTIMIIGSFIAFQDFWIDRIPSSSEVYDKLGIPITHNLVLDNFEIIKKDKTIIDINGFIINKSNDIRRIPPLKITLLNKQGATLKTIITKSLPVYFNSNQKHPFYYKITNVPANTHLVSIKVADKLDVLGIKI